MILIHDHVGVTTLRSEYRREDLMQDTWESGGYLKLTISTVIVSTFDFILQN